MTDRSVLPGRCYVRTLTTLIPALLCLQLRPCLCKQVSINPPGEEVLQVRRVTSENGALRTTLYLGPVHIGGTKVSLESRSLNGSVPGPTLVVNPGDRLRIRLENRLEAPDGMKNVNTYAAPNKTNLHVHGLHVSPLAPGDDVIGVALKPGEVYVYEHRLLADHSPGTYWYHPHFHGSTLIQSGAGAAGALIVADPPGFLSEQLEALPETVLVLQEFPRTLLNSVAAKSDDQLFRINNWEAGQDLWLTNGALLPVLNLQAGVWHRLRIVAAGVSTWLNLQFGSCRVALLAKDGIYIDDFPRFVSRVKLPQGGRADVVVQCPAGADEQSVDHEVVSSALPAKFAPAAKSFSGPVLTLRAHATGKPQTPEELMPWAPPSRPRYLQDLRDAAAPICSCPTTLGLGGNTRWIEGHLWEGATNYLHRSPKDAVVERRLAGVQSHPYHQHTFPFQLLETPAGEDSFFQSGDWHDTYLNVRDSRATIRYSTVDYMGPQVVHCHNPAHSDNGMIAVELVSSSPDETECGCDLLGFPAGYELAYASFAEPRVSHWLVVVSSIVSLTLLVALVLPQLKRHWRQSVHEMDAYQRIAEPQLQPQSVAQPTRVW